MARDTALKRYLERHIEPNLPDCPTTSHRWQHVLVIPAFRESSTLLQRLKNLQPEGGTLLVILVLNRPDSDTDTRANEDLRQAIATAGAAGSPLLRLNPQTDLYLFDMDQLSGPNPADQGVGRARKAGCDLALHWIQQGAITADWIHSTDADAELPADYFSRLPAAHACAATWPFRHVPGGDEATDRATALYELRLHYYVLGLEYAASPYAYHTLGSCLAFTAHAYAQVRGFPRRAGGEDFYLLNKLAKVGTVEKRDGNCIRLESRQSQRVPFGTGPAVQKIIGSDKPAEPALFYHPHCFHALRAVLHSVPELKDAPDTALSSQLRAQGLEETLADESEQQLLAMGLNDALLHCRRQGRSAAQFQRQFHQWFDGFRTLKFIHGLRARGWQNLSLDALLEQELNLLPTTRDLRVDTLLQAIRKQRGWI